MDFLATWDEKKTASFESCSMGGKLFKKETHEKGNGATVSLNYFHVGPPNGPAPKLPPSHKNKDSSLIYHQNMP